MLKIAARHFYIEKAVSGGFLNHNNFLPQRFQALFRMSEYFTALFCGKYIESDHEVVSIHDVDPQDFLHVLQASDGSLQISGDSEVSGLVRRKTV